MEWKKKVRRRDTTCHIKHGLSILPYSMVVSLSTLLSLDNLIIASMVFVAHRCDALSLGSINILSYGWYISSIHRNSWRTRAKYVPRFCYAPVMGSRIIAIQDSHNTKYSYCFHTNPHIVLVVLLFTHMGTFDRAISHHGSLESSTRLGTLVGKLTHIYNV